MILNDPTHQPPPVSHGRIDLLDVLRAVALLAMATYHFTWDLEFFGYVPRGLTGAGAWRIYARCIASSFLFLVGVGLVLAHARAIRWPAFRRRWAQVAGGAAAITAATYVATPGGFVFFGILHHIAAASLLGLLFLRWPWALTALAGIGVVALPWFFETAWTEPKWLAWIGLADHPPVSNDYVPLFPWFGVVLFGIAAGRLALDAGVLDRLRRLNPGLASLRGLRRLGRHSLLFYLLHQPILIGLVAAAAAVAPPDPAVALQAECRRSCLAQEDERFCRRYCGCVTDKLKKDNLLKALVDGTTTTDEDSAIRTTVLTCSAPTP